MSAKKNSPICIAAFLLLLSLPALQCSKKYTCSYTNYYQPVSVAFVGYSPAQLDTIIIASYTANTGLVNPLSADTLYGAQAHREGDTTYSSVAGSLHEGFLKAMGGIDYKVILPSAQKEYTITAVREGPQTVAWEQKEPCSPGAGQARIVPLQSTVNGGNYVNGFAEVNNYFIFLKP